MHISTSYTVHKLNTDMDRLADKVLQRELGISYKRFNFLFVVGQTDSITQHGIAVALGHSDPAVSNMIAEITKEDLAFVIKDPTHARRRLVALTPHGKQVLEKSMQLLDACFSDIARRAGIDEAAYAVANNKLIQALAQKMEEQY